MLCDKLCYLQVIYPPRENPAFEPDLSSDGVICNPALIGRSGSVMEELMKISSTIKCKSAMSLEPRHSDTKATRMFDNQEVLPEGWSESSIYKCKAHLELTLPIINLAIFSFICKLFTDFLIWLL